MGYFDTLFSPAGLFGATTIDQQRKLLELQQLQDQQTQLLGARKGAARLLDLDQNGIAPQAVQNQSQAMPDQLNPNLRTTSALVTPGGMPNGQVVDPQDYQNQRQSMMIAAMGGPLAYLQRQMAPPTAVTTPEGGVTSFVDKDGKVVNQIQGGDKETPLEKSLKAAGVTPGSPEWKAALNANIAKENYIPDNNPLNIESKRAQIGKDNAEAGVATQRGEMLRNTGLDDNSYNFRAQQYAAGDHAGAFQGLPNSIYGSQAKSEIIRRSTELLQSGGATGATAAAQGANFKAVGSGMAANEKAGANITRAADELNRTAGLVEQSSLAVDRLGFKPLADLENFARNNTSDPAYGDLAVKVQGVKTAYAQAMSRAGVPTESSRAKADALISTARNHKDLMARINAMKQEADQAIAATNDTSSRLRDRIDGGNPGVAAPARLDYKNKYGLQ